MKQIRLFVVLLAAGIALFSCGKEPDANQGASGIPTQDASKINGTTIKEGNNAVGLVTDASGKGIAGIPVTDGYSYTVTDANGVYQMKANDYCRKIYLSIPSQYKIPLDPSTKTPLFYSTKTFDKSKVNRNDFRLKEQSVEEDFTLVMIGDPQCQTNAQVQRYMKETIVDILATLNSEAGKYPNAYGVTLGDVTSDSYDTWAPMKSSMSNLELQNGNNFPIFQCIGNHDHNSLSTAGDYEATAKFVETFGPTDYSFNRGKAHIIVMDDIRVTDVSSNTSTPNKATWAYTGGFSKSQYEWLKEDIAQVADKQDKIVFLCLHIPFRGGSASGGANVNKTDAYYQEMLQELTQFKDAHIMIGHTHYPQNYIHSSYKCKSGRPIYEHVHGAACGAWWSCNSNVTGAPNGYSLYQIEGSTVKNWIAKGTNRDADYQMRVYDGNQLYNGNKGYEYAWYRASNTGGSASIVAKGNAAFQNCFIAEIWNDDAANWKVEMYQNGVKIGDFKRAADGSSCNICITSYFFNQLGKNSGTWSNKTASHYWYFSPTSGQPESEKDWEVRATQTIPGSGEVNTFSCSKLTTNYEDF